ncbi:MAG: Xaa-Pro peptidase family protein [Prevotella sp.]|nr:Xaa-Pro peptidase family protein [Prevotella sp.]MCM1075350.1 Xaa-Pro peptidase family protein [Ruminococcus sp.]
MQTLQFTPECQLRISKVRKQMALTGIDALLITDNTNIYYLTGAVFRGYVYVPAQGRCLMFVIRPVELHGDDLIYIRKPEQIVAELQKLGLKLPSTLGLELDDISYSDVERLKNALKPKALANASTCMRRARMVKTELEIKKIHEDGIKQASAYHKIPRIYKEDMTDVEFQIEVERLLRLEGCLGYYRTSGRLMEINMGSVLNGDNADNPTPYDFAVGGGGVDLSLPVGADGRTMRPGTTVMVDMCGNFNGYQSDMTRVWSIGSVDDFTHKCHECSRRILRELEKMALPGVPVADLYHKAKEIVEAEDLQKYFMGHLQQAPFIGHGVGIQLNELPVITPRSKDVLEENMVLAIEPKFVVPKVGAVGVENTYRVSPSGLECLTPFSEELSDITF